MRVEFNHTVALGIVDRISKDACALRLLAGNPQLFDQIVAVKNVVAKYRARTGFRR